MMTFNRISAIAAICGILLSVFGANASATESRDEYMMKVNVENHLENRLLTALKGITGSDKLIVIVNAQIDTDIEEFEKKRLESELLNRDASKQVLPGVPVKNEIGRDSGLGSKPLEITTSKITQLNVSILVDKEVPEEMFDVMRDMAINAIGYNPDRGDILKFTHVKFKGSSFEWASLLYPPHLYWLIIILLGWMLLVIGTFFVMNPFKKLTFVLRNINWENTLGGMAGPAPLKEEGKGEQTPQIIPLQFAKEASDSGSANGDTPVPFIFVKDSHIPEIAFLLKDSDPEEIAIVANYLDADKATKLLDYFSEDVRTEIAVNLSNEMEVDREKVQRLEESLRMRLNFIVGGGNKLASILDMSAEGFRNKVFEKLETLDTDTAQVIKSKVKSFRNVLLELPPQGIQLLFRQIDPTTFARLLLSSPVDVQTKVLDSLSEGASERLRQEMELSRPFTKDRLQKEKFAVISIVRQMYKAGLIEENA